MILAYRLACAKMVGRVGRDRSVNYRSHETGGADRNPDCWCL